MDHFNTKSLENISKGINFPQKIIILVFLIAYVIAFFYILYSQYSPNWRLPYSSCPDFWVKRGDTCYNIHKIKYNDMLIEEKTFDMNDFCETVKDIQKNDIIWDGISYGYGKFAPCKTS